MNTVTNESAKIKFTEKDLKETKRVEKDIGRLYNILRRLESRTIKEDV
tara:strand:+ start:2058 stop:2201 length:144 start_codon:yes stop_codon:yes gene_type:complete